MATNTILADIARTVAGHQAEVRCLVSTGADPHGFEPRPSDVAALARADIVFSNGSGMEPWLDRLLNGARFRGMIVRATDGCDLIDRFAEDHEHIHGSEVDPHAWHDPRNGIVYADNIAAALSASAPDHAQNYRWRARLLAAQLQGLHSWAQRLFAAVPPSQRRIVTSHDSLQYLGAAYRLHLTPLRGLDPYHEPDARRFAALVDRLRQQKVQAIFVESTSNPKTLEQLARDTGVRLGGELYTDSLGDSDSLADSYLGLLRENVLTIMAAIEPAPIASAP